MPSTARAPTAVVIGGGVAGLAAAIQLARAGLAVRLLERGERVGGKLREVVVGGRALDAGPSVLTMRWVFEELFDSRLAEHVTLLPLDPLCRHFFADGSVLDLHTDGARSREAIARFAGWAAVHGYDRYRRHAAKIFEIVRGPFMERAVPPLFELMSPRSLLQMAQIDGLRTLWKALEEFFPDERLRALFGRYATYNGSSPFHAPATLAVIAHVENAYGIFAVRGGIYRLAEALAARAASLGVTIETSVEVEAVLLEGGRAIGVRAGGRDQRADVVVACCEAAHLYEHLLGREGQRLAARYQAEALSLSAFLLLAVAPPPVAPSLVHHNVFFSPDYRREFDELIAGRAPSEPTVYLCAQDRAERAERANRAEPADSAPPAVSGPGSEATSEARSERFFFLTNAPPAQAAGASIDWSAEAPRCRNRIHRVLGRHGWTLAPEADTTLAPPDFARLFPSSRGAIYGLSSNSRMAAFKRPANRVPGIRGLYLAGGTAHPGAGMPMVALSARIAAGLVREDLHI